LTAVVVDTSVVSYLLKDHSLAPFYREHLKDRFLAVSFMTVAELYRWPFQRGWGESKVAALRSHLQRYVVLPYDDGMCWAWARIMSQKGRPISEADGWIAATAICHGIPLVTHNLRNFQHVDGLSIITVPAG
jgi:tRNA(fMet)-specific endonuclease VapC